MWLPRGIDKRRMVQSLNLLMVSPEFVPVADAEAFCGGKMALALMKCGVSLTVVSRKNYPWPRADASPLWQPLASCTIALEAPKSRAPLHSIMFAARYRTVYYARWVRSVVAAARACHSQKPYDLVYSRSLPMFGHVAGYWCARELGLRWIVNVNDPWDFPFFPGNKNENSLLQSRWSLYWLRKTIREADLVTYPSRRLHRFHEMLSGVAHAAEVIPHAGLSVKAPGSSLGFTLVHAGKMGGNELTGRNTHPLLRGLKGFLNGCPQARAETRLVFVGPEDAGTQRQIQELGLAGCVTSTGILPYQESLKLIAGASVCVLIEADEREGIFLPSKLVDYLSAGKPVLALSPPVGVVNDMVPAGGILRVDPPDDVGVKNALTMLYGVYRSRTLARMAPPDTEACRFAPQVVARQFLAAATLIAS